MFHHFGLVLGKAARLFSIGCVLAVSGFGISYASNNIFYYFDQEHGLTHISQPEPIRTVQQPITTQIAVVPQQPPVANATWIAQEPQEQAIETESFNSGDATGGERLTENAAERRRARIARNRVPQVSSVVETTTIALLEDFTPQNQSESLSDIEQFIIDVVNANIDQIRNASAGGRDPVALNRRRGGGGGGGSRSFGNGPKQPLEIVNGGTGLNGFQLGDLLVGDVNGELEQRRLGVTGTVLVPFNGTALWRNDLFLNGTVDADKVQARSKLISSGTLVVVQTGSFLSDLSVAGNTALNGDTDIGNSTGDTLTVTARIDSDLIPATDSVYSLGSNSLRWKDLFVSSGSINIGTSGTNGILSFNTARTTFDFNRGIDVHGNISGTTIQADNYLASSGVLRVSGDTNLSGQLTVSQTGTFRSDLLVGTGTLFANENLGRVGINTTSPETELEVVGTISGTVISTPLLEANTISGTFIHAEEFLGSSGQLVVQDDARLRSDVFVSGSLSGNTLTADSFLGSSGLLVINGNGTFRSDVVVQGNLSGSIITADNRLASSGVLVVQDLATFRDDAYVSGTVSGAILTADSFLGASGVLKVTQTGTFLSGVDIAGLSKLNGNIDLGDATSDTLTVTARIDSDLVPTTDATYDLGTSALRWKELFVSSGSISIGEDGDDVVLEFNTATDELTISDNVSVTGTLSGSRVHADGDITASGNLSIDGDATIDGALTSGTLSGNTIHANNRLSSSGTLSVLGVTTLTDLIVGTVSGTNLTADSFLGASGVLKVTQTGTFLDGIEVAGFANLNGNVELGSGMGGSVTFAGQVDSNIMPALDATYTLGSSVNRWKDLFVSSGSISIGEDGDDVVLGFNTATDELTISDNVSVAGTISGTTLRADGDITASGELSVEGNTFLYGDLLVTGSTSLESLDVQTVSGAAITADSFLGASGVLKVTQTGTFLSGVDIAGLSKLNGDIDLGDATSDTLTVNARIDSDLVPTTDATYNLGTSALRWKELFVSSGSISIGEDGDDVILGFNTATDELTISDNVSVTGTLSGSRVHADGDITASGNIVVNGTATFSGGIVGNGDLETSGTLSGSVVHASNELTSSGTLSVTGDVSFAGGNFFFDAMAGFFGIGTSTPETELEVVGTVSGTNLHAESLLSASGGLTVEGVSDLRGDVSVKGVASGAIIQADNRLASSGTLEVTQTGSFLSDIDVSGNAFVDGNIDTLGTISGSTIHASNRLTSSGVLSVDGDAELGDGTLFVDSGLSFVGIGTVTPETALEVVGTISGTTLHAENLLSSSGGLRVAGTSVFLDMVTVQSTLSGLVLHASNRLSSSGVLAIDGNADVGGELAVEGNAVIGSDTTSGATLTLVTADGDDNPSLYIDSGETSGDQDLIRVDSAVSPGSGTTVAKFRVEADGDVFADGTLTAAAVAVGGADYAEWIEFNSQNGNWNTGDVLCQNPGNVNQVSLCNAEASPHVIGVVSTAPGVLGGTPGANKVQMAFFGQVPANASGEVTPGDYLTNASTPGLVRRAEDGEPTIGRALTGLRGGTGQVQVLISRNNSSISVAGVESRIYEELENRGIGEDLAESIAQGIEALELEQQITDGVQAGIEKIDLSTQVAEMLSAQIPYEDGRWNDVLTLEKTLEVTGDVTFNESLNIVSALNAGSITAEQNSIFLQDLTVQGALTVNELNVAHDASIGGTLSVAALVIGGESFDPSAISLPDPVNVRSILAENGLTYIGGNTEIAGNLKIDGHLTLNRDQAGYLTLTQGQHEIRHIFDTPFSKAPVITASANQFVVWRIKEYSTQDFILQTQQPVENPTTFHWHAFVADGVVAPSVAEVSEVAAIDTAAVEKISFYVDSRNKPVAPEESNEQTMAWFNRCINEITEFDADGKAITCRDRDGNRFTNVPGYPVTLSVVYNRDVLVDGKAFLVLEDAHNQYVHRVVDTPVTEEETTEEETVTEEETQEVAEEEVATEEESVESDDTTPEEEAVEETTTEEETTEEETVTEEETEEVVEEEEAETE